MEDDTQSQPSIKVAAFRFFHSVRALLRSDVGRRAKILLFILLALFCGISALNVANSYVGRNFMTAIAERQPAEFSRQALIYVLVFAASTGVAVIARFAEERLALLWREFLTHRAIGLYASGGTFYRVSSKISHPDQRIADDINAFTITTLSFVLMLLNSLLTVLTFSSVLWLISPLLFIVAVVYAAVGSYMTIVIGRPLIGLNHDRLDAEAAFRSGLIHMRENAESIALASGGQFHAKHLIDRFDHVVANFRQITLINRNVGFFTTGYNWMIQVVPVIIIAPAFINGQMEFGVITQSAAAFATLVGAFSFIVRQIHSISAFATVVTRITALIEAMEEIDPEESGPELVETTGELAYKGVTLGSTDAPLVQDLTISIPAGMHLLVAGGVETAGPALFRATAGIGMAGNGQILRPKKNSIRFVSQRPYILPGTLRQILVSPERHHEVSDEQLFGLLKTLGLGRLLGDGLDREQNWATLLSPREQHLLVVAAVLSAVPKYVLIEKGNVIFGREMLDQILKLLTEKSIACINFTDSDEGSIAYDAVLQLHVDGSWTWVDQQQSSGNSPDRI
ncbi:ABC transporter ATP-binding protein/permease [Rhizobium sp. ZW T2_16]|uniref:ABC transporter ATP-binding protein/permease n=1 Tax=Rhizobium sp. ZW T2_16 TaxID=3378083 RepID=UPI003851A217